MGQMLTPSLFQVFSQAEPKGLLASKNTTPPKAQPELNLELDAIKKNKKSLVLNDLCKLAGKCL